MPARLATAATVLDDLGWCPVSAVIAEKSASPAKPGKTPAQKAASAFIAKIKREAAAKAKRAAAVAEAAGDLIPLPALKSRGALVAPLSLELATAVVRAATVRDAGLTVDVETTGYPIGHPWHRVQTVQLGDWADGVVWDPADPAQFVLAQTLIEEAPVLRAYSATADLAPLAAMGMIDHERAWERMHDVVIPAQLAQPVGTMSSEDGLKAQSAAKLGEFAVTPGAEKARGELFKRAGWLTDTEITTPWERSGWAQVDKRCATMLDYAASDVLDTAALRWRLPEVPQRVLSRERGVQRLTARVSYRGLALDRGHIDDRIAVYRPLRNAAVAALARFGIDNPASNDQVGQALIARGARLPSAGKSGKPSVAADVVKGLRGTGGELGELVNSLLTFRKYERSLSTYLLPYQLLATRGDGRVRPTIYTLQADTGRMSCVRPNLQNVTRVGGIRPCVWAGDGYAWISADFSGVEIVTLAALSQDPVLMDMLAKGVKLHKVIAAQVFGPGYTDEEYYMVKRGVFGRFYGGGIPTLARQVGCSEQMAAAMVDVLDSVIPVAKAWGMRWRESVKRGTHKYELYSGRTLHLTPSHPHKVVNYLVQGTARELLVDGLLRWGDSKWGDCTVLPIHDEVIAIVPWEDRFAATAELIRCMGGELYGVPVSAEAKEPSRAWKDAA